MQPLLNALEQGALVVTPNQRLSHTLKQSFFRAFPKKVQPHPHCLPYASFLSHCYELLTYQQPFVDHPSLLKPHQTQFLWQQVIGEHFDPTVTRQSLAAWQDCKLYRVPLDDAQFAYNTQTQIFQDWALKFEQILQARHLITADQLISYLKTQTLKLPYPRVIFACFDDFNPDQIELQQWLGSEAGCLIETYDLSAHAQQTFVFAAEDEKNEQDALFDWLESTLPHADSIGVVVPELSSQASALNYALKLRFPDVPIHLSLGQPLAQAPIVSHALAWLQLSKGSLPNNMAKLLLHSPFLKDADSEFETRSMFMSRTPLLQARQIPFHFFTQALQPHCPKLAELLTTLPRYPKQDTPTNWAMHFINRLIHCGFPGVAPLTSTSYQTYQRLLSLLDAFKELSLVCPQLTHAQALKYVKQLAHETVFQAEMQEKPKIHVLGLLEAAGLPFEKLWIMGLTDRCLPSHSMPTPYIPLALQRTYRLPHSNLEHETTLAEIRLSRFEHASQETILSYAIGSNLNRPSPLLHDYPLYRWAKAQPTIVHGSLEYYQENSPLPMRPEEERAYGGHVLAAQAKCAFLAFATHRLRLSEPEPMTDGLSAKIRGIVLHRVLELFWKAGGPLDELPQMIQQVLMQALPPTFPKDLYELEQNRLEMLVHEALTWENTRPGFRVEALEAQHKLDLGPLQFHVRLDRIDTLHSGEQWVIDYKTSIPSPLPWNSDTPLEPQLLMYALIDAPVQAILFQELKKGKLRIKGISAQSYEDQPLSTLKTPWETLKAQWRDYLTHLATQFHEGHCVPEPAVESLCMTCPQQNFCRKPFSP